MFDSEFVRRVWRGGTDELLLSLAATDEPKELKFGNSNVDFLIDLNLLFGDAGVLTGDCTDVEEETELEGPGMGCG